MGPNIPPVPEQNPDAPGPNEPPFIYCCKKCGFRAQFLTRIHEHIRKAHRVVCVYSCPYCNDYKGEKERDAYAHIVTRHPERDPDVPVCLCLEPRYISKFIASIGTAGQNRRGKVVTKMTSYNCRYCPLEFTEAVSLLLHITKLHDKTIVYLCPFCKEFTSPITFLMKEHLRVHHNKDASKESVYAYLTEKDAPEETQPFVPLSLASNATTKRCLQQPLNADVSHQDDVIIVNTSKASTLNKGTQSSHPTIMRQMLFQPPRPILPKMALHRVSSLSKTSPQVSASQPQPVLLIPASNLKSLALNKSNVDRQSTKEDTCSPPFQSKLADSTGTQELLMDCETVEEDQMNQSVVVEEEDVVITDVCKAVPISTAVTSRKMYAISSPGQTGHQNKSVFQAPSSLGNSNQQTAPTIYLSSNENIKRGSNLVHIHDPTSFSAGATKDTIYIPGDMSKAPSPVLRVPSLGRPRRPYSVLSANANQIWKTPSKDTLLNRLIQAAPPPNVCVTAAGQISDTTLSSNFHQKKKSYTVVPGSPLDLSPAKSKMMLNLSDSISDASIHRPPPDVEEISPDAFKVFNLSPGEASEPPRPSSAIYIPPSNSSYPSMVGSYPAPPISAIARPPQPVGPPVQNTHIQQLLLKNSPHSFVVPKSRVDKTDLKVLKCEKCDFKTYYRAALKTHETFKHSQIYRCPYCPDVFPMDSFEVEPHIRSTHPGKKIAFMRIG